MPQQRRHRPEHGPLPRGDNLLPNPRFDQGSETGPHRPEGWSIVESPPSTMLRTGRAPYQGRWALDARLALGPEGEGTVQLVCRDPVAVLGGSRLLVGGTFLREQDDGPPDPADHGPSIWIAGRWLRTRDGSETPVGNFMTFPGLGLPVGRHETRAEPIVAPHDADAIAVVCVLAGGDARAGRFARVVIDSLFLRPAPATDHRGHAGTITQRCPRREPDRGSRGPAPLSPLLA